MRPAIRDWRDDQAFFEACEDVDSVRDRALAQRDREGEMAPAHAATFGPAVRARSGVRFPKREAGQR